MLDSSVYVPKQKDVFSLCTDPTISQNAQPLSTIQRFSHISKTILVVTVVRLGRTRFELNF